MKYLGSDCFDCPILGFVNIGDGMFLCAACFERRRASQAKSISDLAAVFVPPDIFASVTADSDSQPQSPGSVVTSTSSVVAKVDRDAPARLGVSSLTSATFVPSPVLLDGSDVADFSDLEDAISALEQEWLLFGIDADGFDSSSHASTFAVAADSAIQFASSSSVISST